MAKKYNKNEKSNKKLTPLETVAFILAIIGMVAYISYLTIGFSEWGWDVNEVGKLGNNPANTIGTFIGGVITPIFTLAGVFFFYSTLRTQKDELELQKEELRLTRKVLKKQRKSLNDQAKTLKQQQFETTFFNILNNNLDILNDIKDKHKDDMHYGTLLRINKILYADSYGIKGPDDPKQILLTIIPDYQQHLKRVFLLLKFIAEAKLEKLGQYVEIAAASMQGSELETLLTFCIAKENTSVLRKLNEQFTYPIHENYSPKYLPELLNRAKIKYEWIESPSA
ncbi:MAG: hypothetical protein AAGA64_10110 [Bacteroidota bacterium]